MGEIDDSTPSSGQSPPSQQTLSVQINTATRLLHTKLNRQIISRLPLALPPYSTNPSKYVSGLLHIAPIYITFEALWQQVIDTPIQAWGADSEPSDSPVATENPRVSLEIQSFLAELRLPGLVRAARLRADIQILSTYPEEKVDEQLRCIAGQGKLADFIAHTKKSVAENPHVLIAYTWVLYMALFSGGRILRASLRAAGGSGKEFWDRDLSPIRPYSRDQSRNGNQSWGKKPEPQPSTRETIWTTSNPLDRDILDLTSGLSFFGFSGDHDGEDLKTTFKSHFSTLDTLLTPSQKSSTILEAQEIFTHMLAIVSDLDAIMCHASLSDEDHITASQLLEHSPLKMTSRDSVSMASERFATTSTMPTKQSPFLEVFKTNPMLKIIRIDVGEVMETVVKPLGRRFSKEGPSKGVSFAREMRVGESGLALKGLALLVLIPGIWVLVAVLTRWVYS
ncbi:hypothetical protein BGZ60DRAFT_526932 [Tricladium varicosporioides]|nr:hypothetical protein BGZ60DRAFT_526932 [Hymenoscyphus varicosporioides]